MKLRVLWEGNVGCLDSAWMVRFRFRRAILDEQLRAAPDPVEILAVKMKIATLAAETESHVRKMWREEAAAKRMAEEIIRRAKR